MFVLVFLTIFFSETFLILRRNEQDMMKYVYWSLCVKCPVFLSDFNETWILLDRFFEKKNLQISNFMKNQYSGRRVVPCGRTDMTTITVDFRKIFANALKNSISFTFCTNRSVFSFCLSTTLPYSSSYGVNIPPYFYVTAVYRCSRYISCRCCCCCW
jgi:hypothetical protein